MRKLLLSVVIGVFLFGLVAVVPATHAQDDVTLVCSAPINDTTLGVVPTAVTFTLSAELEEATATVTAGEEAVDGVETTVDGVVVTVTAEFAAGTDYTVALDDTNVSITFSVNENAVPQGDAPLRDDCPAEAATDEAATDEAATEEAATDEAATDEAATDEAATDEAATDEAATDEEATDEAATDEAATDEAATDEAATDEAATDEADTDEAATDEAATDEEATDEAATDEAATDEAATDEAATDEAPLLAEEPYAGSAGTTNIEVGIPADYVAEENDSFFLFPIVVMAPDEDTAEAYTEEPDSVAEFIVIYTTFTTSDLPAFSLEEDADLQDIIAALLRPDSDASEPEDAEVAGADALRVEFTNETSGKAGEFYTIAFEAEDGTTNYMLIQGSAPADVWPDFQDDFQAVVDSITIVEGAE